MFRGKENFNHQYVIASCSWTFLNSLDRVSNSPLCRNWIGCRCVLFFSFVLWRSIVLYVNQFCQLVVQVDGWNSCWILLDKKREVEKRKIERNLSVKSNATRFIVRHLDSHVWRSNQDWIHRSRTDDNSPKESVERAWFIRHDYQSNRLERKGSR